MEIFDGPGSGGSTTPGRGRFDLDQPFSAPSNLARASARVISPATATIA
jgi:hypothetical protein